MMSGIRFAHLPPKHFLVIKSALESDEELKR
jgi:hypothetical protein